MKRKSFTRALASISAAVLLAVSLTPQTIPAMAAENSISDGSASQVDQVDAAQPAAANEAQPAETNTVQIPEEQPEQSEGGEAETLAESNQGAENSQEASASDDSAATEEADAEETADAEEDAAEDQTIADTSMETAQPEETVTVTYEASEGGHVSKESETFVKGADSAALTGAEAEAEDGYEFVDWTEDGVEVSTDAVFVPDATAIDADTTFTANFKVKEVEETWPAVDFAPRAMSAGTVILVSAPEGAFPAGVQMRASVVEPKQVVGAIAEATPDDDAVNAEQIAAYDISFYLPADPETEIEPRKAVQVSFENLPLQDEVTKGSSLEVWHIDDSQAANAGDIEKQSTDGDVSVSIKAQSFSTYAIRAKAPRVTSNYTFDSQVDLSDDISVTPDNTTALTERSGRISVTIKEQDLLGSMKTAYDNVKKDLDWYSGSILNWWSNAAYADRTKSMIPITISLPEGFAFQNVQTSSDGASLLVISSDTGNAYLPATVTNGNELTVYINFAGSASDSSICYLKDVLNHSTEKGSLKITAEYTGKIAENMEQSDVQMQVSGGSGFLFGNHLAVNVDFSTVRKYIPSAYEITEDLLMRTSVAAGQGNDFSVGSKVQINPDADNKTLSLRVDFDLSSIVKKLNGIRKKYQEFEKMYPGEKIGLEVTCTFWEKFTVPDGLTFPDEDKYYTIIPDNSAFKVDYTEG